MGDWPQLQEAQQAADFGTVSASSVGTTLTAGTANTKGSWAQLSASTSVDASQLLIGIGKPSAAASFLVDLGVGAAASEYVIFPNCRYVEATVNAFSVRYWMVPLAVPAGTRLAARTQSSTASATVVIQVIGFV